MRLHALVFIILTCGAPAFACPSDQHDECVLQNPFGDCIQPVCVPNSVPHLPSPGPALAPIQAPVPSPAWLRPEVDELGPSAVKQLGEDTLTTFQKAGGDTTRVLQKADGDTFATIQKAGDNFVTPRSKLPKMQTIAILKNKWVLTSALGKEQSIAYEMPTVVPTYVGPDAAFTSTVHYDRLADSSVPNGMLPNGPSARSDASLDTADVFSDVTVAYYVKSADGNRISDAPKKESIPYTKHYYARPKHERALSNALICGPDTPAQAIKKVALALIDAGVDVKYIGINNTYKPKQIVILNLMSKHTVNYPNITRDQVVALSAFPSELKNGLTAFESFQQPVSNGSCSNCGAPNEPATNSTPVTISELDTRMKYWETRLPFCTFAGGPPFPAKDQENGTPCNDGDSVSLNGLTCAAGDDRGCDAVRDSQGTKDGEFYGAFFRSPKKRYEVENGLPTSSEKPSSNDSAQGVWAYIAQKRDVEAFRRWTGWMRKHKELGIWPRYCTDAKCDFNVSDCPMLDRLAVYLGEGNSLCDLHPDISASSAVATLQDSFNDTLNIVENLPGANLFAAQINNLKTAISSAFNDARAAAEKLDDVREKVETLARVSSHAAEFVAFVGAYVNKSGAARQDVAYSVFLLKKYGGLTTHDAADASSVVASKEGENAFF
jgi:hypothetical protein